MNEAAKLSTGIDIVSFVEVSRLIETERRKSRIFSQREREYCDSKVCPVEGYAARFAAKEAALKALGIGIMEGFSLADIETTNSDNGKPQLRFLNRLQGFVAEKYNIIDLDLSLSHSNGAAVAVVVMLYTVNPS